MRVKAIDLLQLVTEVLEEIDVFVIELPGQIYSLVAQLVKEILDLVVEIVEDLFRLPSQVKIGLVALIWAIYSGA